MSELVIDTPGDCISEKKTWISIDIIIFFILLIVSNMHLLQGSFNSSLIFIPSAVLSGEWWRIITYPFVHITWYHLLLDAGAFFLLYRELYNKKILIKISYVAICSIVSLAAALAASPVIYSIGLCGLSGIAHGLMAISGLEMMHHKSNFRTGLIFFIIVVSKSIYETIIGDVFFSFMHLGMCGVPLAASHAGGVLGGIIAYYAAEQMTQ